MKEAPRQVGKASILDGSKPQRRDAKGRGPHWVFHWDLIEGPYRLSESSGKKLEKKWKDYYRARKNRFRTPFNLSFGPTILWFPVLEEDREEWERYLTEVLSNESNLSNTRT